MTTRNVWVCLALGMILLGGCASPSKARFYTLGLPLPSARAGVGANYSVVIGPTTVPEAVDRPQIVVRVAPNRVEISDVHRWAEPLRSAIPRVLAQALAGELDTTRVAPYGQVTNRDADFQVVLDVQRFESALSEGATIEVLWSVRRASSGKARTGRSLVREPVFSAGYDGLVAAHGRALQRFGVEIATAVRTLQ